MSRKYKFSGETKVAHGKTLHQIRRLSDGKLGGWIESEDNYFHDSDGWIYPEAIVLSTSKVYGGEIRGGVIRGGMKVTVSPIHLEIKPHSITIADNVIRIGCKVMTYDEWIENGEKLGKNEDYSEEEIAETKSLISILWRKHQRQLSS